MIFNEAIYPLFLLVSVLIFFQVPVNKRAHWLVLSGSLFYAYYADLFFLLFAGEAILIYVLAKKTQGKAFWFWSGITLSVSVLALFKYRNMLLLSVYRLEGVWTGQALPEVQHILLPLAISFFTFEFIHYLIDQKQGKIPEHRFSEYMAFILFFPTMIAGPIKRFQDFVPQLKSARFSWAHINAGLGRILIGSAKKMIVADSMDLWIQPLYAGDYSNSGMGSLWIALLAYALKIYLDFSGYSDIAIGSARLFGIEVPENFNFPYLRPNIALFWRNWHISLTSWITDYVFIPLGGSRVAFPRILLNLILAMAVSGIWHGAAWHFLFWGLAHGLMLAIHRFWRDKLRPKISLLDHFPKVYYVLCTLLTFSLVTLSWGLFILPLDRFIDLSLRLFALT